MLIASPLSPFRLFAGKFTETALASSWVLLVFYVPAVSAVGAAFGVDLFFHAVSLIYVVPLIVIPCSISIIASILFVRLYPARRVRELLVVLSIVVVIGLHFGLKGHQMVIRTIEKDLPDLMSGQSLRAFTQNLTEQSLLFVSKPFNLAAAGKYGKALEAVLAACAGAVISMIASFRCFKDLYLKVYSIDSIAVTTTRYRSHRRLAPFTSRLVPDLVRAFAAKDYRLFLRDIAQPVQLILFLCMGVFAVMGFKASGEVGASMRPKYDWWDDFIMCINLGFHSLLSILFAGRFIFPSIASEGEASWMIKSAPIKPSSFFNAKLIVNAAPSVAILTALLVTSCFISDLASEYLFFTLSLGFLNTICIAAIAVGLGAYFSNVRYEHVGQLSTGIGSVLSMFISLVIIPLDNILTLLVMLVLKFNAPEVPGTVLAAVTFSFLALFHAVWIRYFLSKGQERWSLG